MGYAPWSRISLPHQHVFHFPVCRYYSECFENSENEGIDTKRMEKTSFLDDSKYNNHYTAKYSGCLYDDALI
jgi:hypothetical protein